MGKGQMHNKKDLKTKIIRLWKRFIESYPDFLQKRICKLILIIAGVFCVSLVFVFISGARYLGIGGFLVCIFLVTNINNYNKNKDVYQVFVGKVMKIKKGLVTKNDLLVQRELTVLTEDGKENIIFIPKNYFTHVEVGKTYQFVYFKNKHGCSKNNFVHCSLKK